METLLLFKILSGVSIIMMSTIISFYVIVLFFHLYIIAFVPLDKPCVVDYLKSVKVDPTISQTNEVLSIQLLLLLLFLSFNFQIILLFTIVKMFSCYVNYKLTLI